MNQSSRQAHLTGLSSFVTRQVASSAVYEAFIPPWVVHPLMSGSAVSNLPELEVWLGQLEQRPDRSQAKATTPLPPEPITCLRSSELSSAQRTG